MPDDADLKLTLYPNATRPPAPEAEGSTPRRIRQQAAAQYFQTVQQRLGRIPLLRDVVPWVQATLVDLLLAGKGLPKNPAWAVSLPGPNGARLPCEVFEESEPQACTPEEYKHRTVLKLKRTLRILKQLRKAYPDADGLEQLEALLQEVDLESEAHDLDGDLREVLTSSAFSEYLGLKTRFLEEWKQGQLEQHAQTKEALLTEATLQETVHALQQQEPRLAEHPDILLYEHQEFFRMCNTTTHPQLNTTSLEFWETEERRDQFTQFLETLRDRLGVLQPFHILRFEHSFTYLLVGTSDEEFLTSLQESEEATHHAKVILRLSGQQYQELKADPDTPGYAECLKHALHPFVVHLNEQLELELPDAFVAFFETGTS